MFGTQPFRINRRGIIVPAMSKKTKPPLLYAVVAPGLEKVAAEEARAKGFRSVRSSAGGFTLRGSPLRANRALSIPSRILLPVAEFKARHFSELEAGAREIDWTRFRGLTPVATSNKSRLFHTKAIEGRLSNIVPEGPGTLKVRVDNDQCTFSVDTTGELLHRRGWRKNPGTAPVRETLAAGMLALAGWKPGTALYDPMCGSGTFPIEAAIAAAGRPPGGARSFDCDAWWKPELPVVFEAVETVIAASDQNQHMVKATAENMANAEVEFTLTRHDAKDAVPPAETGLLICNPPYGKRSAQPAEAFDQLGALLKGPFKGWRAGILCPAQDLAKRLGRKPAETHIITNGGIKLRFLVFEV